MIILGIETSCDETSLCIMKDNEIISLKTYSQIDLHNIYGGVVPELASRDHLEKLPILMDEVICDSDITYQDINLISCTHTPGLIGSLMIGVLFANGLSIATGIPLIFVDHLLAHAFTCNITHKLKEDFLCLLISGGHTIIYDIRNINQYKILGQTIDDSFGEVFDKISKSLGFGYPGGELIEKLAVFGDSDVYKFNIPLKGKNLYDFSLSGLKTEYLKIIQGIFEQYPVPRGTSFDDVYDNLFFYKNSHLYGFSSSVANLCASFQKMVVRIIIDRLTNIVINFGISKNLVICGGVASNIYVRKSLTKFCLDQGMNFYVPDAKFCTDNAAMVANIGGIMWSNY